MFRRLHLIGVLALAGMLSGCLENREQIVVHPDGAVTITVSAKGDAADLAEGSPVPLGAAGWTPLGADTARWIAESKGASGAGRGTAPSPSWPDEAGNPRGDIALEARASFDSVRDLPATWAPASDPYASAALQRRAELTVTRKSGRVVTTFERRYLARSSAIDRIWKEALKPVEDFGRRVKAGETLNETEIRLAAELLGRAFVESAGWYAREAVGALYTEGDASLPVAAGAAAVERARAAAKAVATTERLLALVAAGIESERGTKEGAAKAAGIFLGLERDTRGAIRAALAAAAEAQRVPEPMRNGVLHRLEWLFAHHDHTSDLGDESFVVEVTLPGTIVSGNFDRLEGSTATWRFDAAKLADADFVMTATSVRE